MKSPHGMKTPEEIGKSVLAVILFLVLIGSWVHYGAGWTFAGVIAIGSLVAIGWRLVTGHWPTADDDEKTA